MAKRLSEISDEKEVERLRQMQALRQRRFLEGREQISFTLDHPGLKEAVDTLRGQEGKSMREFMNDLLIEKTGFTPTPPAQTGAAPKKKTGP